MASIVLGKEIVEKYLRKINHMSLMKKIDKEPKILGFNLKKEALSYAEMLLSDGLIVETSDETPFIPTPARGSSSMKPNPPNPKSEGSGMSDISSSLM